MTTTPSTLPAQQRSYRPSQRTDERLALRRPCAPGRRAAAGFTLLELMVTVTVSAIILSIGVPSFASFLANTRATTYTNDLVLALNLARGEATRRGAPVTVCSSADAATCSDDTDWSTGWVVLTAGGEVVRSWGALDGGPNVIVGDGGADRVLFEPRGSLIGPNVVLNVRIPNCIGDRGRDISINRTGRVSVVRVDCGP